MNRKLVGRLAQQVYLVESACRGLADGQLADTFVELVASADGDMDQSLTNDFANRLTNMYRQWAERRGMTLETLEEGTADDGALRCVLSVSGFGAYQILEPEGGLHVHELPSDGKQMLRCRVRVTIVPQPEEPAVNPESALAQSRAALAAAAPEQRVVRRYRAEPSPLVRDSVRNFKTGLLQRVLDGEFDVLGSS